MARDTCPLPLVEVVSAAEPSCQRLVMAECVQNKATPGLPAHVPWVRPSLPASLCQLSSGLLIKSSISIVVVSGLSCDVARHRGGGRVGGPIDVRLQKPHQCAERELASPTRCQ